MIEVHKTKYYGITWQYEPADRRGPAVIWVSSDYCDEIQLPPTATQSEIDHAADTIANLYR